MIENNIAFMSRIDVHTFAPRVYLPLNYLDIALARISKWRRAAQPLQPLQPLCGRVGEQQIAYSGWLVHHSSFLYATTL